MPDFKWDVNGTPAERAMFLSKEAFDWVKANKFLPLGPPPHRIHKIEFFSEPFNHAIVHRYPGAEGGKASRYEPMAPPLQVPLEDLPPESLVPRD
jgi:hypothetical protein